MPHLEQLTGLWVYLEATPLLWLTATVVAYFLADAISARLRRAAWAHPVVIAVVLLIAVLVVSDTSYDVYFQGAQFIQFLLGPATVALAVPLVRELSRVRRLAVPLVVALLAGSLTAIVSAVAIGWAMGADRATLASLAPKSVTTPIGMALAQAIGGIPALTAVIVILTGIVAAMSLNTMARLLQQRGHAGLGLAAGVGGGGLGTAQAVLLGELAGAFGGLGLALNGLVTSILVPVLAGFWP